jgi:hypothetical protein
MIPQVKGSRVTVGGFAAVVAGSRLRGARRTTPIATSALPTTTAALADKQPTATTDILCSRFFAKLRA